MSTHLHHRCERHPRPTRDSDREGAGARPKGVAPSSAQVWVLSTALAEPKIVTLRWRSRRARRPPGRHFVCEHRREHSGNLPMA